MAIKWMNRNCQHTSENFSILCMGSLRGSSYLLMQFVVRPAHCLILRQEFQKMAFGSSFST